ncbi:MAG TPA: SGNH/GDSL hydrolase family protein [Actinoplanes sp.]|nr:SGNH/GDSL hydrolase family protein [Actinoplanes sp.]
MTRHRLGSVAASLVFGAGLVAPTPALAAAAGAAPLRIMPLGDSITVGSGSPGRNGWRADLQRRLRAAGVRTDFVGSARAGTTGDRDHEGHGGWTIEQLAGVVGRSLATYRPDVVLLHAGTNNITRGDDPVVAAGRLSALIDRVRAGAPDADVYVATIVGTAVAAEVPANHAYNALIPAVVRARGPRVHLVDQSVVTGVDIYDRHHPNRFGYRKMAYTWYEAIRGTLHPEWPGTGNPFRATSAHLCHAQSRTARDCRTWHLRRVTVTSPDGRSGTERRWQTRRTVTVRVWAWTPGHYREYAGTRRWVPGRYVLRKLRTARWSST